MTAPCRCRQDHPFPLADCGCQECECRLAAQAPPLDMDVPVAGRGERGEERAS